MEHFLTGYLRMPDVIGDIGDDITHDAAGIDYTQDFRKVPLSSSAKHN